MIKQHFWNHINHWNYYLWTKLRRWFIEKFTKDCSNRCMEQVMYVTWFQWDLVYYLQCKLNLVSLCHVIQHFVHKFIYLSIRCVDDANLAEMQHKHLFSFGSKTVHHSNSMAHAEKIGMLLVLIFRTFQAYCIVVEYERPKQWIKCRVITNEQHQQQQKPMEYTNKNWKANDKKDGTTVQKSVQKNWSFLRQWIYYYVKKIRF